MISIAAAQRPAPPAARPSQRAPSVPSPNVSGPLPTSRPIGIGSNNVVPMERGALSSREELERQARAQLEADNAWWRLGDGAPANVVHAASPRAFKAAILGAANEGRLVLVDYFRPSCLACRSLAPKVKQLAAQNAADVLVVQVNTDDEGMRDLADAMGVEVLPWFQIWRGSEPVAGLTANVSTISRLRAEVAAHKPCTDPLCETN